MVLSKIRNFFRGSSDSNLSMYPMKGNCRFPNIFEQLANGRVESVDVVTDGYFIAEWKIGINVKEIDDEMHLIPFISYESEYFPKCGLRYYLGIKNSKYTMMKKVDLLSGCQAPGFSLKLMDLKPELLDDGTLIIEYGIRVDALQRSDNIWYFQLLAGFFDSKGKQVMSLLWENEDLRCHPQIKAIHYDNSLGNIQVLSDYTSYISLQIAHGVRYQDFINDIPWLTCDARVMGFRNVVQYCQWELIQNPSFNPKFNRIFIALEYNMRIYLAHLIREMNSKKKLMKILKIDNLIDVISGEYMKAFMKFLLYD